MRPRRRKPPRAPCDTVYRGLATSLAEGLTIEADPSNLVSSTSATGVQGSVMLSSTMRTVGLRRKHL